MKLIPSRAIAIFMGAFSRVLWVVAGGQS